MQPTSFQNWLKSNSIVEEQISHSEGKDFRWARLKTCWEEKKNGLDTTLFHRCAFILDLQTGDVHLDCSKKKIWTKCFALSFARPLVGLVKTAYHVCLPISLPIEIFKAISKGRQEKQSAKDIAGLAWSNVKMSLVDIVRTPVYTLALTIIAIAAVIIGPFAPRKLYEFRHLEGQLEIDLVRGQDEFWMIAPCFHSFYNLMDIHKKDKVHDDTKYHNDPTMHGCNNITRNYVIRRRSNRLLCNDCGTLLSENKAYTSPAFPI